MPVNQQNESVDPALEETTRHEQSSSGDNQEPQVPQTQFLYFAPTPTPTPAT